MPARPLPKIIAQIISWLSGLETADPRWSQEEWQTFKQVTFIHGIAPYLHKQAVANRLPQEIQYWLNWQYQNNKERISRLQSDLRSILASFAAKDIPLMPLKGAVLTPLYYEDIALRPTADLDLLIKPQNYNHSLQILAKLGYEIEKSNWKHTILSRPNNRQVVSFEVEHPDNPRRIDLHTACQEMFSGPYVDITAEIWATSAQKQLLSQPAHIPDHDLLTTHLLLHTSSNIWNGVLRLINLLDLVQVETRRRSDISPNIDHRFIYPALAFYRRYFPNSSIQENLDLAETAVPRSFKKWVASQDIISRSRLQQETKWGYLTRLWTFYRGRPQDIIVALRSLPKILRPI